METITEADCKMSVYIWNILRSQIQILWSWGFSDVRTIKNGIRFHVQGFKLKGVVEIRINEGSDLFDVSLFEEDGRLRNTIEGVFIESLVSTIDNEVEYTGEDYADRVKESLEVIKRIEFLREEGFCEKDMISLFFRGNVKTKTSV